MLQRFTFSPDEDIIARTRWYIHFRWFYIFVLSVPVALSVYLTDGRNEPLTIILSATTLALISNGVFYVAARYFAKTYYFQIMAAILLASDILIINYIVFTTGGAESRTTILYVLPIIMSAIIFARKGIYAVTAFSLLSYNTIIITDYLNFFPAVDEFAVPIRTDLTDFASIMIFFSAAMIATMVATDFIVKLLRQKELEALETIEDLKTAQAVGKFGSWEWDTLENRISWSDEMFRLIGLDIEAGVLSFERYVSFVHSKDRRRLVAEINKASKQPRRFRLDHRIISADGAERYIQAEGQSLADRSGRIVSIVGTARDITEERLLDQSKNEFVSLASHQLRTPATIVKQYLNMLIDGYAGELTEKQRDFLRIASDTNEHQINIVNNLLGVAQLESGKIQLTITQVDLVVLVQDIIEEYGPRARTKDQILSFSTRYKHLYCRADEHSLRTVLENILDNAFKYTMPGKAITIKLAKEANNAIISVTDQGVGIASKDLPKLFKKFSRIENPETFHEEGAGLGLYWAEKVIGLHGGKVNVESELGKGTTIRVVLPMRRTVKSPSSSRSRRAGKTAR